MIITITDNFDIDKIIDSGQTFRARQINNNLYRFVSLDHILYISKDNTTDSADTDSVSYQVSCDNDEWDNYWHNYFDLGRNYSDIVISDDYAKQCYETSKGIRILRQDPLEMLLSFIISQRKSIPAIRTSIEAICKRCGTLITTEYEDEVYLFPTPYELQSNIDELSECKLGYRLPYIQDAINTVNDNPSFLSDGYNMSDDKLLEHLMTVKGVGTKVANCIALFAYNRVNLAPIDTWISKIIDTRYNGASPFDNYGEYAGIIQQYMFYHAITHKDSF